MVPFECAYLLGTLILLFIWIFLYWWHKDTRREMLFFSLLTSVVSPITAYIWWTIDWWHPLTITGSRVGVEDIIIGFVSGGVATIIYSDVFKMKMSGKKAVKVGNLPLNIALGLFIIGILFWGFGMSSFLSSTVSMLVFGSIIVVFRKDLFVDAVMSGVLTVIAVLPFYYFLIYFSPGWIDMTYDLSLSGIKFTGIPVEELVFYFLFGFCVGPSYEYWKGRKLVKR